MIGPSAAFEPYLGGSCIYSVLNDLSVLTAALAVGWICSPTSLPCVRENVKKADPTGPANDSLAPAHTPESFLSNSSILGRNRHNG